MFFEFIDKRGHQRCVRASISELPALVERMKEEGWSRLFYLPTTISVPGYYEAVEESTQLVEREDRKRAVERVEAARDLARAVHDETK
ncbi:MAG TPA: hypothetical protein VJP78_09610 [Thermoleophilia bacterium]|nr:hypothetical protein [Thermoleophilia bacterium]